MPFCRFSCILAYFSSIYIQRICNYTVSSSFSEISKLIYTRTGHSNEYDSRFLGEILALPTMQIWHTAAPLIECYNMGPRFTIYFRFMGIQIYILDIHNSIFWYRIISLILWYLKIDFWISEINGSPKIDFLDIEYSERFFYIHNSIEGYPKFKFWISINRIMDIQISGWILDIHNSSFLDIHNSIYA